MIALVLAASVFVLGLLVVEVLRWRLRPAARRLRVIKKIGDRR